jgi:four helix bundle protein
VKKSLTGAKLASKKEPTMAARHYQELIVWQKALDLVVLIYQTTASSPREEQFGLTIQLRKAAVSIPSNIAEGQARNTPGDFLHFLAIARGSLQEVETQIIIAERLRYITAEKREGFFVLSSEVGRLINGLSNSITPGRPTSN